MMHLELVSKSDEHCIEIYSIALSQTIVEALICLVLLRGHAEYQVGENRGLTRFHFD